MGYIKVIFAFTLFFLALNSCQSSTKLNRLRQRSRFRIGAIYRTKLLSNGSTMSCHAFYRGPLRCRVDTSIPLRFPKKKEKESRETEEGNFFSM